MLIHDRKSCLSAAALVVLWALSAQAMATEGGGSQYAIGVETHYSGLMLPEGFHTFLYYQHFGASHNKGNDGNDNRRLAYFKATSDALAMRISYVWPGVQWLGANPGHQARHRAPAAIDADRPQRHQNRLGRLELRPGAAGLAFAQPAPDGRR
jgi:hypothetical protein